MAICLPHRTLFCFIYYSKIRSIRLGFNSQVGHFRQIKSEVKIDLKKINFNFNEMNKNQSKLYFILFIF